MIKVREWVVHLNATQLLIAGCLAVGSLLDNFSQTVHDVMRPLGINDVTNRVTLLLETHFFLLTV